MLLKEFQSEVYDEKRLAEFFENFDHHSDYFRDNYFDVMRYMVTKSPIFRATTYGGWGVISKYADMRAVATDPATFPNDNQARVVPAQPLPTLIPPDVNPPEHTFYRQILNPLFSPSVMAKRRDEVFRLAHELLVEAKEQGSFDIIDDYAKPLTGLTSFKIIGIEPETWPLYDTPISNSTFSIGTEEERAAGYIAYEARVKEAVAAAVKNPDPDTVIGAMALSSRGGRAISEEEICQTVNTLIIGGLGTTQAVAGSAAVYLGRNPNRRQELLDHPERVTSAINEFLRLFSSAPMTGRKVPHDTVINGHTIRAGEILALFWGAGNFDPDYIDRPFEVDFQRPNARNTTFALGPHMCLGQHLARLELEAMLKVLLEDIPNYSLVEEGIVAAPQVASVFGYAKVPVRVG